MSDVKRTIGEMTDVEARLVMLRAAFMGMGDVPEHARRLEDGGYVLTFRLPPGALAGLPCAADVGLDYDVRGACGRLADHNYHRGDPDCDDRDAHAKNDPYTLHHPFVLPAHPDIPMNEEA